MSNPLAYLSCLILHRQLPYLGVTKEQRNILVCLAAASQQKLKTITAPPPSRPAQPDTYMITLAGAGSLLGQTGRGGGGRRRGGRGGGGNSWRSNSRGAAGGGRRGGEVRRCSSSRQPGLLTDLTRGQRGGSLQRAAVTHIINQIISSNQPAAPSTAEQEGQGF